MVSRALLLFSAPAAAWDFEATVPSLGVLHGTASRPGETKPQYEDVAMFLAIPYAKPPVGDLRWQPPVPYGAWESPRDATQHGHSCMQSGASQPESEDCLFLNVATPKAALSGSKKLPVMFWIHGGSYQTGQAADYPIDALVKQSNYSVVVAATNYRLNVFGFMGGSQIAARTSDGSSGNFGIQDQRLGMTWVRDHIAAFGGDGSHVMIFGESAGGNSVMNHLAQPASFSLYKMAIMESGTYYTGGDTMATADTNYKGVLSGTRCQDLACLLKVDAKTLATKGSSGGPGPIIDGVSMTAAPWDLVLKGQHNTKAKVMLGGNADEAAMVTAAILPEQTPEGLFDLIATGVVGLGDVKTLKSLYDASNYNYPKNLGPYNHWWWATTDAMTDTVPGLGPCGARAFARDLLAGGSKDVYTYFFAKPSQTAPISPSKFITAHACEIGFVYGDVNGLVTESEKELAIAMSAYWSSFAINGDPNHEGLPTWPIYDPDLDTTMSFYDTPKVEGVHAEKGLRKAQCDFWDTKAIKSDMWQSIIREQQAPDNVLV